MQKTQKKIIGRIAVQQFPVPVGQHLLSEKFSRFCRQEDLDGGRSESRDLSRDRPDLNGDAVIKNAFAELLSLIHYWRPEKVPALFVRFLSGFSPDIARQLPLEDLKKDLREPGYPAAPPEKIFSGMITDTDEGRNPDMDQESDDLPEVEEGK